MDTQIIFDKNLCVLNGDELGYSEVFQEIVNNNEKEIIEIMSRAASFWGLMY